GGAGGDGQARLAELDRRRDGRGVPGEVEVDADGDVVGDERAGGWLQQQAGAVEAVGRHLEHEGAGAGEAGRREGRVTEVRLGAGFVAVPGSGHEPDGAGEGHRLGERGGGTRDT